MSKKREYLEVQLELIESPVYATRRTAQTRILYLLQGESEFPDSSTLGVLIYRMFHGDRWSGGTTPLGDRECKDRPCDPWSPDPSHRLERGSEAV